MMRFLLVITTFILSVSGAQTIFDTAQNSGQFTLLLKAAEKAGLVDALKGSDKLTVLAPNDQAFSDLPSDVREDLLLPENKYKLANILKFQVISGEFEIKDFFLHIIKD